MKIQLKRFTDNGDRTLGLLFIDGVFRCYNLEDEERTVKVWGETRIPEGTYKLGLRTTGGHHARYSKKFPDIHKGMLHILDVPNFKYILIHIGNTDDDTAGCLLTGSYIYSNNKGIGGSTLAYEAVYPEIANAIASGEDVEIEVSKIYNDC
jgi:hypothetical protein